MGHQRHVEQPPCFDGTPMSFVQNSLPIIKRSSSAGTAEEDRGVNASSVIFLD